MHTVERAVDWFIAESNLQSSYRGPIPYRYSTMYQLRFINDLSAQPYTWNTFGGKRVIGDRLYEIKVTTARSPVTTALADTPFSNYLVSPKNKSNVLKNAVGPYMTLHVQLGAFNAVPGPRIYLGSIETVVADCPIFDKCRAKLNYRLGPSAVYEKSNYSADVLAYLDIIGRAEEAYEKGELTNKTYDKSKFSKLLSLPGDY